MNNKEIDAMLEKLMKNPDISNEELNALEAMMHKKQDEERVKAIPDFQSPAITEAEFNMLKENIELVDAPFKNDTELGETFTNLDNNTHIDMNSRLNEPEISAITQFDELQNLGILPREAKLTQTFKRLKVSLEGKGRSEKVNIVTGHKQQMGPQSFMDLFKKKKEEPVVGNQQQARTGN